MLSIAVIAKRWSQESGIERASLEKALLLWAADYVVRRDRPQLDPESARPLGDWRPPLVHREYPLDWEAVAAFCAVQGLARPAFWSQTEAPPGASPAPTGAQAAGSPGSGAPGPHPAASGSRQDGAPAFRRQPMPMPPPEPPRRAMRLRLGLGTLAASLAAAGIYWLVSPAPLPSAESVAETLVPGSEALPVAWSPAPELSMEMSDSALELARDAHLVEGLPIARAVDLPTGSENSPQAEAARRATFEAGLALPAGSVGAVVVAEPSLPIVAASLPATTLPTTTLPATTLPATALSAATLSSATPATLTARAQTATPAATNPAATTPATTTIVAARQEALPAPTPAVENAALAATTLASLQPAARGKDRPEPATDSGTGIAEGTRSPRLIKPLTDAQSVTAAEAFQEGDRRTVRRLQRTLAAAGLYDGAIDGLLGPQSRQALYDLRQQHGLPLVARIDQAFVEQVEQATAAAPGAPSPNEAAPQTASDVAADAENDPATDAAPDAAAEAVVAAVTLPAVTLPAGASGRDYAKAALQAQKAGQFDRAVALYGRAIDSKSLALKALAHAYNNRAAAWTRLGNPEKALRDYSRAIQIVGRYPEAFYNRGAVQLSLGRPELALRDFGAAIRIRPTYLKAYSARAKAMEALRRYEEAIADYTEIIRMDPTAQLAYAERGRLYGLLGSEARALEDQRAADRLATGGQDKSPLTPSTGQKG